MQIKLLCSVLLLTGVIAVASEKNEQQIMQKASSIYRINSFSTSPMDLLTKFALFDSLSGRIAESVMSKSGNMVIRSGKQENT